MCKLWRAARPQADATTHTHARGWRLPAALRARANTARRQTAAAFHRQRRAQLKHLARRAVLGPNTTCAASMTFLGSMTFCPRHRAVRGRAGCAGCPRRLPAGKRGGEGREVFEEEPAHCRRLRAPRRLQKAFARPRHRRSPRRRLAARRGWQTLAAAHGGARARVFVGVNETRMRPARARVQARIRCRVSPRRAARTRGCPAGGSRTAAHPQPRPLPLPCRAEITACLVTNLSQGPRECSDAGGQRRLRPRDSAAAGRGGPRPRTPAI